MIPGKSFGSCPHVRHAFADRRCDFSPMMECDCDLSAMHSYACLLSVQLDVCLNSEANKLASPKLVENRFHDWQTCVDNAEQNLEINQERDHCPEHLRVLALIISGHFDPDEGDNADSIDITLMSLISCFCGEIAFAYTSPIENIPLKTTFLDLAIWRPIGLAMLG